MRHIPLLAAPLLLIGLGATPRGALADDSRALPRPVALPASREAPAVAEEPPLLPRPYVERAWRAVHPAYRRAYVLSYRSPDLLSNDPDEQWGRDDSRLEAGGILSDFPLWLARHAGAIRAARAQGRPVLLSLHFHSGYGVGIVSYSTDLSRAEAANYPWLIRTLTSAGLHTADVTIAVDTCNSQATAAHQLRPDLIPRGVEAFPPFAAWRRGAPGRAASPQISAWPQFVQDRVRAHLAPAHRGRREHVRTVPLVPLSPAERGSFQAHLYGQKGVILATPCLFNLLRLGPEPAGTLTANLLRGRIDTSWIAGLLQQNNREFVRFREFAFLEAAGPGPVGGDVVVYVREVAPFAPEEQPAAGDPSPLPAKQAPERAARVEGGPASPVARPAPTSRGARAPARRAPRR